MQNANKINEKHDGVSCIFTFDAMLVEGLTELAEVANQESYMLNPSIPVYPVNSSLTQSCLASCAAKLV